MLGTLPQLAQVTRTTLFGVGRASVLDTYLTPYTYTGWDGSVEVQTERHARWGGEQVTAFGRYSLRVNQTKSEATGAIFYDGQALFADGWHYNWKLCQESLRLGVGGLVEGQVGGTYSSVGGNNPGQARVGMNLDASALMEYRFRVGHKQGVPWVWRCQLDMPLIGAAFSQQYGESYYELFYLKHYDHNVRCTHPFNAPTFRFHTRVQIPVRKSYFSVGYSADVRQSHLNRIKQHGWCNEFTVGFTRNVTFGL